MDAFPLTVAFKWAAYIGITYDILLSSLSCHSLKRFEQYQLNGYTDYFNVAEPSTTSCPYLPGQEINILEVPIQIKQPSGPGRRRSTSSTMSAMFTLNPEDKYALPKPPPRTSYLERSSSTPSVSERFEKAKMKFKSSRDFHKNVNRNQSQNKIQSSQSDTVMFVQVGKLNDLAYYSEPISTRSSLQTVFANFRRPNSARGDVDSIQHKLDLLDDVRSIDLETPSQKYDSQYDPLCLVKNGLTPSTEHIHKADLMPSTESRSTPATAIATTDPPNCPSKSFWKLPSMQSIRRDYGDKRANFSIPKTPLSVKVDHLSAKSDTLRLDFDPSDAVRNVQPNVSLSTTDLVSRKSPSAGSNNCKSRPDVQIMGSSDESAFESIHTNANITINSTDQTPRFIVDYSSSHSPSQIFSPTLSYSTLTDLMVPSQPSQPDTPIMSEFSDDGLGPSQSTIDFQSTIRSIGIQRHVTTREPQEPKGFEGYSLPKVQQASTLTLQNLPLTPMSQHGSGSTDERESSRFLVESWNDGSEHRNSAIDDIFEDLTYLGGFIH